MCVAYSLVLVNIYKEASPGLWGNARVFCQGVPRLWFSAVMGKVFPKDLSWAIRCALRHLGTRVLLLHQMSRRKSCQF